MQFYRVIDISGTTVYQSEPWFCATFDSTKEHFKKNWPKMYWDYVRVELVEIDTDKATLVLLLNKDPVNTTVLRTWKVTPRGGLTEIENGE